MIFSSRHVLNLYQLSFFPLLSAIEIKVKEGLNDELMILPHKCNLLSRLYIFHGKKFTTAVVAGTIRIIYYSSFNIFSSFFVCFG